MRVPYEKAISFIRDHGHFAAMTLDGILATSEGGDTTRVTGMAQETEFQYVSGVDALVRFVDDVWFVETTTFDVDEFGMVDVNAVRIWLGY